MKERTKWSVNSTAHCDKIMKNLLKKDRLAFVKDAQELFARLGFTPYPEDVPEYDYRGGSLRIMTDYGIFRVHEPDADFGLCSINGHFEDTSHFKVDKGWTALDINPYSGKWCILHSDPQTALDQFAYRMDHVSARALHPGEMDEKDAAFAVRLAEARADMKAFLESKRPQPIKS